MRRYVLRLLAVLVLIPALSACTHVAVIALNQFDLTDVAVEGDKLYLMGALNSGTYEEVVEAIEANPQVRTVVLTASPGSIDEFNTLELAHYIREHRLNTHLLSNSAIASGGVDLFVAGVERTIERGAQIGVHAWSDLSKDASEYSRGSSEHKPYIDFTRQMLGSEEFYWFTVYAAKSDDMHWMTEAEVERFGLATAPLLEASGDPTPFKEDFISFRKWVVED